MTNLSPAAQAVLYAYWTEADRLGRDADDSELIAAVLRAVADEVTPHMFLKPQENLESGREAMVWGMDQQTQLTRQKIRAIASELGDYNV
jgi:hypothetical protein